MKGFPDYPFSYAEAVASTKRLKRRLNGSPTSPGTRYWPVTPYFKLVGCLVRFTLNTGDPGAQD